VLYVLLLCCYCCVVIYVLLLCCYCCVLCVAVVLFCYCCVVFVLLCCSVVVLFLLGDRMKDEIVGADNKHWGDHKLIHI